MIPHTLVLKPGLVVHSIYNGYWFWGRPSIVDLWHDLRDGRRARSAPTGTSARRGCARHGRRATSRRFHGWNKWDRGQAGSGREGDLRYVSLRGRAGECALLDGLLADDPPGREPVAGPAGRGRDREDGAARVPDRVGVGPDRRAGGRAWSRRWSWRSPACISCARRCSIGSARLPAPQRQALEIVFGLSAGAAPDRFLVGLAVLSLFSEVAEERPLLCVVDDAQWLDQASALTLAFVARRLLAEPVGIVFAAREPGEELRHVPELEVHGLRDGDARALLGSAVRFMLDERVRDRIIAETRGNPLALLELPRGLDGDGAGRRVRAAGRAGAARDGSRRASSAGSRRSPRTRGVCCWSRRPSRSAIRCCSGARPSGSGSGRRPRSTRRRTGCWRSASA